MKTLKCRAENTRGERCMQKGIVLKRPLGPRLADFHPKFYTFLKVWLYESSSRSPFTQQQKLCCQGPTLEISSVAAFWRHSDCFLFDSGEPSLYCSCIYLYCRLQHGKRYCLQFFTLAAPELSWKVHLKGQKHCTFCTGFLWQRACKYCHCSSCL